MSWSYSTDAVGNVLSITESLSSARTYGYQDVQYFLTQGHGPWGTRSWTYDKIGNRLTETRGADTDSYHYLPNGAGGNTPQIERIVPPTGPATLYSYDDAGNVLGNGKLSFSYGEDRRLSHSGKSDSGTTYSYDGRGYLSRSSLLFPLVGFTAPPRTDHTLPTYSSDGLLHHRFSHRNLQPQAPVSPTRDSDLYVFHFAGRPVATLDQSTEETPPGGSTTTSTWQYLTVDHLGTPILATSPSGAKIWQGGFEPFGADYSFSPTILRFPGQWVDATWNGSKGAGLYYNVHRWYEAETGRYIRPDPLGLVSGSFYEYADHNPVSSTDVLGLFSVRYIPLPNREVQRACGSRSALGCVSFRFELGCDKCKCINGSWFSRPWLKITEPVPLYYSTDCYSAERLRREEERHVRELQNDVREVQKMARNLAQTAFKDEHSCEAACQAWRIEAAQTMRSFWAHWWIDYTHPWRACSGGIF